MMLVLWFCGLLIAETGKGQVIRIQVPGPSLAANVIGEPSVRFVSLYLPPGYAQNGPKRFPVVYLLHGIGDNDQTWTMRQGETVADVMDREIGSGRIHAFILVMPSQRTRFFGSFYTNSPVSGRWEDFTTQDLVTYIDANYRTLANAASRGIAGHSMGGYGALMLGMKNPHIFSVVYGLNPAVLGWGGDLNANTPAFRKLPEFKNADQLWAFMRETGDIYPGGIVCVGQAFSPNPNKPPFYMDSPFVEVDGAMVPNGQVHQRWQAHMPIFAAVNHRSQLMKLKGYRFDSGFEDEFTHIPVTAHNFSKVLDELGVPHVFEAYNGDHRNRLYGPEGRLATEVFPYFSRLLVFEED